MHKLIKVTCCECGVTEDRDIQISLPCLRWWAKYYSVCSKCGTRNDVWIKTPPLRHVVLNYFNNLTVMKEKILLQNGFTETEHRVLGKIFILDIGRNRHISIAGLATGDEIVFINQKHPDGDITDMVCLHNYDYDGLLTRQKLNRIISIFA